MTTKPKPKAPPKPKPFTACGATAFRRGRTVTCQLHAGHDDQHLDAESGTTWRRASGDAL
jgi:hypothetical protein